ncbi:MAG: transporter substrate-binding domain-containing protein [Clostridium sp.]|uniref:transporter substrate-binding domain-containing protein n=1 Tax=Clostridium sp. TaxID=1506 RepID=UPI002FC6B534
MRGTKKALFLIFTLIMILSLGFSVVTLAESKKVIKVAGDINYPPYEYIDKNGIYTGYNVEIIKKIAKVQGMKIELIPMPWDMAIKALEKGEIDLIQGMTNSGNRNEKFVFSDPIIENDYVIITLKDNKDIESVLDLTGKKVSYQTSDLAEEVLSSVEINKMGTRDQHEALKLLIDKKVDAFVGNKLTSIYYLQRMNALDKTRVSGSPLLRNDYCIVSSKSNGESIKIINEGLSKMKSSGEYDEIYNKWFSNIYEENGSILKVILSVLFIIFILVMVIIFVVAYYNEKLKKRFESLEYEKDGVIQELKLCRDEESLNRIIISKLVSNIEAGLIVFDINGVVRKFNNLAKDILKEDIRIGDDFNSLRLIEILDMDLIYDIPSVDIYKEIKLVVDENIVNYKIDLLTLKDEKDIICGWTMLIRKG